MCSVEARFEISEPHIRVILHRGRTQIVQKETQVNTTSTKVMLFLLSRIKILIFTKIIGLHIWLAVLKFNENFACPNMQQWIYTLITMILCCWSFWRPWWVCRVLTVSTVMQQYRGRLHLFLFPWVRADGERTKLRRQVYHKADYPSKHETRTKCGFNPLTAGAVYIRFFCIFL